MINKSDPRSGYFDPAKALSIAAITFGVSVLLAVTGPFNTFGIGAFGARFVYWGVIVLFSLFVAHLAIRLTDQISWRNMILRELFSIFIFTACFVPWLVLWTQWMFPVGVAEPISWVEMLVYTVAICVAIVAIRQGWRSYQQAASEAAPVPRLFQRLPAGFSGDILRLSADGHHVQVVTTQGTFELRMRLADAVLEVDGLDGACVHRSHWVARRAIAARDEQRGRPILRLVNQDQIPVGPKYQPDLERAGFI